MDKTKWKLVLRRFCNSICGKLGLASYVALLFLSNFLPAWLGFFLGIAKRNVYRIRKLSSF